MIGARAHDEPEQRICAGCRRTRLSRYNPDALCGPCMRAARTPPDTRRTGGSSDRWAPEWVWDSALFRDALARLDPGAALVIFRAAAGLSQLQLAQILGCSQTTVWRLEAGERKSLYDIRELLRFVDTIGMPRHALLPLVLGQSNSGALQPAAGLGSANEWLAMDWRPKPDDRHSVAPARVGPASTGYLFACAEQLHVRDQLAGGATVRAQALRLWSQACDQLDDAVYDDATGIELMRAAGELAVLAGWACYDSDETVRARRLYADAVFRAGQARNDRLAVHAMANQTLLFTDPTHARRHGLARQAIWLIGHAAELARRDPSSRLHALIAAREATARASVGDRAGFRAAIIRARRELDRDQADDDPAWLAFFRPGEITAHEARGQELLGDSNPADLYRESLQDSGLCLRNAVVYRSQLAAALAARGDVGQAVTEASAVLDHLEEAVSSPRALALLWPVRAAAEQAGLAEFCARYTAMNSATQPGGPDDRTGAFTEGR